MPRPVHFEIHAGDPAVLQTFYEGLFGWSFHRWGDLDYWLIGTGDGNPMTGVASSEPGIDGAMVTRIGDPASDGQAVNSWVVTVAVPDCHAYFDAALAAGATEAMPVGAVPGVGWLAYIKDPDGNLLGLMQNDPDAA